MRPPVLRILGSGSSGNLALIDLPGDSTPRQLVVDLGLGPRTTRTRLAAIDRPFDPEGVVAALVTHADQDHLRPSWGHTLTCHRWRVHSPPSHHAGLVRLGVPGAGIHAISDHGRETEVTPGVRVTAVIAPHDDHGTAIYRITIERKDTAPIVLGWATDLGRVTPAVESLLEGCDVIAIESNYDPKLQADAPRPPFLKRRITGGHGHLSNREAMEAVRRLADRHEPSAIALLHLSRDCNHPDLVRRLWKSECPKLADRLHIAHATSPLPPIELEPGRSTEAVSPPPAAIPETLWT